MDPERYYRLVATKYAEILQRLERSDQPAVVLDIDETIHCNHSEMPTAFAAFTEIPLSTEFIAAIAHRRPVHFCTGRSEAARERTVRDLSRFTYSSVTLHSTGSVREMKQGVIRRLHAVGIGDQLNDISSQEFKIPNEYYTILADGSYLR